MRNFRLYQIESQMDAAHGIVFSALETLEKMKKRNSLTLDLYDVVYEGTLEDDLDLEDIYTAFQGHKPEGYKGHSVSMSDVVEMEGKFYYCDRYEWVEITFAPVKPTIRKDDRFLCKKDYVMENNTIAYVKGKVYLSEKADFLTDEDGSVLHRMNNETDFYEHFARVR